MRRRDFLTMAAVGAGVGVPGLLRRATAATPIKIGMAIRPPRCARPRSWWRRTA